MSFQSWVKRLMLGEIFRNPDAIFVGGTGRAVIKLVEEAWSRLRVGGRLVVNIASLENLTGVEHLLRQLADG